MQLAGSKGTRWRSRIRCVREQTRIQVQHKSVENGGGAWPPPAERILWAEAGRGVERQSGACRGGRAYHVKFS